MKRWHSVKTVKRLIYILDISPAHVPCEWHGVFSLSLPSLTSLQKSPLSDWRPLSVTEGIVEVVTDKGWFLSSYMTQGEAGAKVPLTSAATTEDSDEEDRRTSMDSGVSMESNSIETRQERPSTRQDDSGCGSLGGQESSTSDQTTYPQQTDGSKMDVASDKGDRGMGCGFQPHSSPLNAKQQRGGPLKEAAYAGNYRSQIPHTVELDIRNKAELSEILNNPSLADMIQGCRAELQSCICSGADQCTWCRENVPRATQITKQYKDACPENGLPNRTCNSMGTSKEIPASVFPKDTQIDFVPFTQLQGTFPMLSTFPSLPPMDGGQDINMNSLSLSLCDVQLIIDWLSVKCKTLFINSDCLGPKVDNLLKQ